MHKSTSHPGSINARRSGVINEIHASHIDSGEINTREIDAGAIDAGAIDACEIKASEIERICKGIGEAIYEGNEKRASQEHPR